MPEPLTGYIDAWRGNIDVISSQCWQLGNALKSAGTWVGSQNWPYAKLYLQSAAGFAHNIAHEFKFEGIGVWTNMYNTMHYVDENIGGDGEAYELTMDKMLEAMWDGDLLRWFHFVTYIDSMRAGIWNLEIYETHLADLYRHFSV